MKRVIELPNLESVSEFVKASGEMDSIVLVSREGFKSQIDGASILGMVTLMGVRILVECAGMTEKFSKMLENYQVAG